MALAFFLSLAQDDRTLPPEIGRRVEIIFVKLADRDRVLYSSYSTASHYRDYEFISTPREAGTTIANHELRTITQIVTALTVTALRW